MKALKAAEETKSIKEVEKIVFALHKISRQMVIRDRFGMIEALQEAQEIASSQIKDVIDQSGRAELKPWSAFSDQELYHMLSIYADGLIQCGIQKVGEHAFKQLLMGLIIQ